MKETRNINQNLVFQKKPEQRRAYASVKRQLLLLWRKDKEQNFPTGIFYKSKMLDI